MRQRGARDLIFEANRAVEVVRVPGGIEAAVDVLASERAADYGENAPLLNGAMARLPSGARILQGRFNVVQMAITVPKGRSAAGLDWLGRFIAEVKRDGTVARAIERALACAACISRPIDARYIPSVIEV